MSDNTSYSIVLCCAIMAIVFGSCYGCHTVEKTNQEAMKAGLEQVLEGSVKLWKKKEQ